MKATICRKANFNATHRLHNQNWSDEKNELVFGKCNNTNYHGHNYDLIVKVTGMIDKDTGFVMDANELKQIIDQYIIERYDHKNLYLDTVDFRDVNPSAENIARMIYKILREVINPTYELRLVLYETERNFVEYPAE